MKKNLLLLFLMVLPFFVFLQIYSANMGLNLAYPIDSGAYLSND